MGSQREIFLASGVKDTEFERFVHAIEFVRRAYPSMTLGAFATFLSVANHGSKGGISPTELGERLEQPLPTIFRQCNQLSEGVPGKPGMNLLRKVDDAKDGRSKKLMISVGGLNLMSGVLDILSIEMPGAGERD